MVRLWNDSLLFVEECGHGDEKGSFEKQSVTKEFDGIYFGRP